MLIESRIAYPFTYSVEADLAANGSLTVPLVFDVDSDFILFGFLASSSQDSQTDSYRPNNFTALIRQSTSGKAWSNRPLSRQLLTATIYDMLPEGVRVRIPKSEQFTIDFVNLSAQQNIVTLSFKGYKLVGNLPINA